MRGLRRLVDATPDRIEPRLMLARALFDAGQFQEIDALFPGTLDDMEPRAAFETGRAAAQSRDLARAVAAFRRAASADVPKSHSELAAALLRARDGDSAVAAAREALARTPGDSQALRVLATVLFGRGDARQAYDLAAALWTNGARNAQLLWTWTCAAGGLGRVDEFARLTAPETLFVRTQLDMGEDVNRALEDEIRAKDALARPASYRPTRADALRRDDFETAEGPAARRFHDLVRREVSRYCDERRHMADHPVITGRPEPAALESWALVMAGSGYEGWHIHPAAWLSGVYYVDVPRGDPAAHAGAIGFGALPASPPLKGCAFQEWRIAPEPGTLVLFPAYFAHRTWPTESPNPRISIAFNAIAA
jgi:tetratricopeptide (TPR) repeat protein